MVGLAPLTVWATAAAATSTTTTTTTTSSSHQTKTHKLVRVDVASMMANNNACGVQTDTAWLCHPEDATRIDYFGHEDYDCKEVDDDDERFEKYAKQRHSNNQLANTVQDLHKKVAQGILRACSSLATAWNMISVQKSGGLFVLPILWAANMAVSRPSLSSASLLASLGAVMAPLMGSLIQQRKSDAKIACHHFIRDSGLFRTLMDVVVFAGLPALALRYPRAVSDFFHLGSQCTRIQYGHNSPKSQVIDMYMPEKDPRGLVFFVHGGAWGSGNPTLYRLAAKPFLEKGMAVAVVGYRTYPEGDTFAQVQDLELAAAELTKRYPTLCLGDGSSELGVCILAHSSGAHICSMMMVERLRCHLELDCLGVNANHGKMKIDSFIGISGPYNIARHFEFEASRGLEQLSPMQPACGGKGRFERNSPTLTLSKLLSQCPEEEILAIDKAFPRVALVHGYDDDTVPVESTQDAANVLRSVGVTKCDELYFSETGHSEIVLELIFGGKAQDAILGWLQGKTQAESL